MFLFVFIGFFVTIVAWLRFDRKVQNDNLYKKDNIVLARVVLNGWNWGNSDIQDQVSLILKNLNEAMNEE